MKSIGRLIKQRLSEMGMSRSELAEALGVSPVTVWYWMNGKKNPGYDRLEELAEILGCSVSELLGEEVTGLDDLEARLRSVVGELIATHDRHLRRQPGAQRHLLTSIEGILQRFKELEAKPRQAAGIRSRPSSAASAQEDL